ncbi:hypothetical protein ACS0TY_021863 [Phlomoides rotata]
MEVDKERCFKLIWNKITPSKVIAHAWRVLWDMLPTKANLRRRNVMSPSDNLKCVLCGDKDETGSHIFFECDFSYKVDSLKSFRSCDCKIEML